MPFKLSKRLLWGDMMRIVAIYLVLVVHSYTFTEKLDIVNLTQLGLFTLAKTCVPLFVMLSGSLLLHKKESYTDFFQKRVSRLLLPWVTWTIITAIVIIFRTNNSDIKSIVQLFREVFLSFWFLPMVIGLYLLTPAMRTFVQAAKILDILFVVLIWFMVVAFLPFQRNNPAFPLDTDNGLLRQVIQYSGYYLIGYIFVIKTFSRKYLFLALFFLIFGILWTVYGIYAQSILFHGKFTGYYLDYYAPGIIVTAVSLFVLLQIIGNKLESTLEQNNMLRSILIEMSKLSLGIYFIHLLMKQVLVILFHENDLTKFAGLLDPWLQALILFACSFITIKLLSMIPHLKRFVR